MTHVDDVVEHEPAVALHRADQFLHRAERGDDQRHLVLDGNLKVRLQARVALVHDQVHAEGCGCAAALALDAVEALADFNEPRLVIGAAAAIERRKRTHDPGAAALHDQIGVGDQKHRRGDRRDGEAALKLDRDWQDDGPFDYSAASGC